MLCPLKLYTPNVLSPKIVHPNRRIPQTRILQMFYLRNPYPSMNITFGGYGFRKWNIWRIRVWGMRRFVCKVMEERHLAYTILGDITFWVYDFRGYEICGIRFLGIWNLEYTIFRDMKFEVYDFGGKWYLVVPSQQRISLGRTQDILTGCSDIPQ